MINIMNIEDLIEEKRKSMKYSVVAGDINIDYIYQEIKNLAETMTLTPVVREIDVNTFFKVNEFEFVKMLYQQILQREPNLEEYRNTFNTLVCGHCDRIQLIENFLNSEEGQNQDVKIIGLKSKKLYSQVSRKLKRIPIIGYICRWVTNIVFLSRRIASLYQSASLLAMRCEIIEKEYYSKINHVEDLYQLLNSRVELEQRQREQDREEQERREQERREQERREQERKEQQQREKEKEQKELSDTFYLHYNEKLMPDSREEVKGRSQIYIPKLEKWSEDIGCKKGDLKFIDLGCGEGEWIELLGENGFHALGVDSNSMVVEKVKNNLPSLEIVEKGAIEYLQECDANSVDCISSFHMVEHMDFITIITLLKECYRVLKENGMLIIETPNPQNIMTSSFYFNLDPTHIKPIPPELMQFFVEESGFSVYEKLLLNPLNFIPYEYKEDDPIKDIVFRFNMEQAHSIMAVKK